MVGKHVPDHAIRMPSRGILVTPSQRAQVRKRRMDVSCRHNVTLVHSPLTAFLRVLLQHHTLRMYLLEGAKPQLCSKVPGGQLVVFRSRRTAGWTASAFRTDKPENEMSQSTERVVALSERRVELAVLFAGTTESTAANAESEAGNSCSHFITKIYEWYSCDGCILHAYFSSTCANTPFRSSSFLL